MDSQPKRGEIWLADLGQAPGIPVLIISSDSFNSLDAPTVIILPIFPAGFGAPSRVRIEIEGAGAVIDLPAFAACEQIRSLSISRLTGPKGMVAHATILACEQALTHLLGLKPMPQSKGWGF